MIRSSRKDQLKNKAISFLLINVFILIFVGINTPDVITPPALAEEPLETITLQLK